MFVSVTNLAHRAGQIRASGSVPLDPAGTGAVQLGVELAARANQAKQAMAADRFDEAAAIYREILQKLPDEPGILMNLGMALAMAGRRTGPAGGRSGRR